MDREGQLLLTAQNRQLRGGSRDLALDENPEAGPTVHRVTIIRHDHVTLCKAGPFGRRSAHHEHH
jgi:hypothetical protein